MTSRQRALYWREWQAVKAKLADRRPAWRAPEWDAYRHELHIEALGCDVSSSDMANDEFDKILSKFRSVSEPENMGPQLRALDQPRRRLVWKIRHGAPEAVIQKIASDKFGQQDLTLLDESQLKQLLFTLARWANRSRKRMEQPETKAAVVVTAAEEVICPF